MKKLILAGVLLAVAGSASAFDPNIMFTSVYKCGDYVAVQMNNNSESLNILTINEYDGKAAGDGFTTIAWNMDATSTAARDTNGANDFNYTAKDSFGTYYTLIISGELMSNSHLIVEDGKTDPQNFKCLVIK